MRHLLEDLSGCKGEGSTPLRMIGAIFISNLVRYVVVLAAVATALGVLVHWTSALPLRFSEVDNRLATIEQKVKEAREILDGFMADEWTRREQIASFEAAVRDDIHALQSGQQRLIEDGREREERLGRLIVENRGGVPLREGVRR